MNLWQKTAFRTLNGLFLVLPLLALSADSDAPDDPIVLKYKKRQSGTDTRLPVKSSDYPFSAIGKVITEHGSCTGTMIGDWWVLTNAHCVCPKNNCEDGGAADNVTFYPNYHKGSSVLNSRADWYSFGKPASKTDWAIIRLRSPLGRMTGYLGRARKTIEQLTSESYTDRLFFAGYPKDSEGGEVASLYLRCSITEDLGNQGVKHDCNAAKGSSGSALLFLKKDEMYITALNWGGVDGDDDFGLAAPLSEFYDLIQEKIDKGPTEETAYHLCNFSGTSKVHAAMAYPDSDGDWISQGHYVIENNRCIEGVIPRKKFSGDIYVYAEAATGGTWPGNQSFAFSSDKFRFRNPKNLSGLVTRQFSKFPVKHGIVNYYSFNP